MKYSSEIEIELSRDQVIALFQDVEKYPEWQPSFISMEPLQGEPGAKGSTSKMKYRMGKREMEMVETIRENNFPEAFHATYDAKGVHNIQENYFEDLGNGRTRWRAESEFQFSGFFMKFMGAIMPGAFKKQTAKFQRDFKDFAERSSK